MIKIFTINFKESYNKIIRNHSVRKDLKCQIVVVLNENIKTKFSLYEKKTTVDI